MSSKDNTAKAVRIPKAQAEQEAASKKAKVALPETTSMPIKPAPQVQELTTELEVAPGKGNAFLNAVHEDDNKLEEEDDEIDLSTLDAASDDGEAASVLDESDDEDDDLSLLEDSVEGKKSKDDEPEEGFLEIDSHKCLKCNSLVPSMEKKYKACHFTSGNKNCPAQYVKIVQKIPLEIIVPRFMAAEKSGNFDVLAKLSVKLAEKPDWYQQRVKEALEKARQSS